MTSMLVTLGLEADSVSDIYPLLREHLPETAIRHVGLLEGLTDHDIDQSFAATPGETTIPVRLSPQRSVQLSAGKITRLLQDKIAALEAEGSETILLLCHSYSLNLVARVALVLEPDRLIPPLVEAIVDGHQVGVVVSDDLRLEHQRSKWRNLSHPPCFAVASPWQSDQDALVDAALSLLEQGADVVVLDSPGYHASHRDFLQKLLGIPVLLTNALVVKLAAELVV